jgi:phage baseplate assembly protein V
MDNETKRFILRLIEKQARKVRNIVARGVVAMVRDDSAMQGLQLALLEGELIDNAEHPQPYGFSSHPLPDAEAFVVFCGADRGHPIVFCVDDRRYRVTGSEPGEVVIYTDEGDTIKLKRGNVIEVKTKGDVEVLAGRGLKADVAGAVNIASKVAINLTAPTILLNGNLSSMAAGGSADFNVGRMTINADDVSINADKVSINGEC